ncbi:MAG TPA: serine/threonine protein kinase, partial [Streptomyces sp.]|nr:serine/threonine protein kinase [Streptomyces sp.]
ATATTASVSGPATPRPAGTPASTRASITDVVPRRTLAIIAGVVVLAVLGTVLALTLGGDDKDSASGGGNKGDTVSSAGADGGDTGGGSGKGDGSGGAETDGGGQKDGQKDGQGQETGEATDGASPSASVTDEPAEDGVPDGYKKVTDTRFHFTMAMPENFARNGIAGSNSGGIYNADGGFPRVQVDYNSSPGTDAAAAWRSLRGAVAGSSSGYKHIGIDKVDYNGYPTVADWEFVRTQKGMRVRVLNRGFKVDATHGYSIMISCKESEWDGAECAKLRQTAFGTFAPTD